MLLLGAMAVMSLIAFVAMGADKLKAKQGAWRIPEATLLVFAALGGAIGALMAMQMFHHKTQHKKFTLGVPLLLFFRKSGLMDRLLNGKR